MAPVAKLLTSTILAYASAHGDDVTLVQGPDLAQARARLHNNLQAETMKDKLLREAREQLAYKDEPAFKDDPIILATKAQLERTKDTKKEQLLQEARKQLMQEGKVDGPNAQLKHDGMIRPDGRLADWHPVHMVTPVATVEDSHSAEQATLMKSTSKKEEAEACTVRGEPEWCSLEEDQCVHDTDLRKTCFCTCQNKVFHSAWYYKNQEKADEFNREVEEEAQLLKEEGLERSAAALSGATSEEQAAKTTLEEETTKEDAEDEQAACIALGESECTAHAICNWDGAECQVEDSEPTAEESQPTDEESQPTADESQPAGALGKKPNKAKSQDFKQALAQRKLAKEQKAQAAKVKQQEKIAKEKAAKEEKQKQEKAAKSAKLEKDKAAKSKTKGK